MNMQLLWVCIALSALVLISTDARYAARGHKERGLRTYHKGHHEGVQDIEPEVTKAVMFVPKTTARPLLQTEKSYSYAQWQLFQAAKTAGERLQQTYQDAKEGSPTVRIQVLDSLKRFGILVVDGAKYVCNRLPEITVKNHSSDITQWLQEKLEQEDEQVAEVLQIIGHKMRTWSLSHTHLIQHTNPYQNAEIQGELQLFVDNGILTTNDVNILVISDGIRLKIKQHGNGSFYDLLHQKINKWVEENGDNFTQLSQEIPLFFQEEDVQGELKQLLEQGILTGTEIKTLTELDSVATKMLAPLDGDLTDTDIEKFVQKFSRIANKAEELQYQDDQYNVEILPDLFRDDEVQDYLQNLVDVGTLSQSDLSIITQQQSQKGQFQIKKRTYNPHEWFNSIGATFNDWGETLSDTASKVGEKVKVWGYQGAQIAGDIKDAVVNAVQKREYPAEINPAMRRRMRSWLNSLQQ